MKRKLLVTLFLFALGGEALPSLGYKPQFLDRVTAWWNTPPAPPSPEAQRLIASLKNAEGWHAGKLTRASLPDCSRVEKANVNIVIHTWRADVLLDGAEANDSFTSAELRAINAAAETCLRKLTAKAMETAAK